MGLSTTFGDLIMKYRIRSYIFNDGKRVFSPEEKQGFIWYVLYHNNRAWHDSREKALSVINAKEVTRKSKKIEHFEF